MIFFLLSKIVATFAGFLYPAWMTFKTLAARPGYEHQAGRWMMYWAIIAMIVAFEYTFEWLVNWIWLYYELKTMFLLFLALPQTEGSTYIYQQFVWPQLLQNEEIIDEFLASLQSQFYVLIQAQVMRVWEMVFGSQMLDGATHASDTGSNGTRPSLGRPHSSSNGSGVSGGRSGSNASTPGAGKVAQDMWSQYGPSVMAAGATMLRPRPTQASSTRSEPPQSSGFSGKGYRGRPSAEASYPLSGPNAPLSNPAFPQPLYPPFVPFGRSETDLPHHPPPFYTRGYSGVNGE